MKPTIIRRTRADKLFDTLNMILMAIVLVITLYPLYFVLIASVSDAYEVAKGNVFLWPKGFTAESYLNVFKENRVWLGYRNTIFYTLTGTFFSLILTRAYFQSNVPEELYESARIDGASELKTFFRIALPLVKPILAVMILFFAVARWNDYFNALIYTTKNDYLPLQMVLRSILLNSQTAMQKIDTSAMDTEAIKNAARLAYMAEAMKYALIVVSSAPLLIAYPFVQKYFVAGMMVGAVKG